MFFEFWKANKPVVELIGVLIAVGALFLAIPIPSDEKAKIALLNIQLVWLLVITLAVLILLYCFFVFFVRLEDKVKTKWNLDIENTITIFVLYISFWLLKNLWQYTLALYKVPFIEMVHFLKPAGGFFSLLVFSLALKIKKSIFEKFKKSLNIFWSYILSLGGYMIAGIGIAFWGNLQNWKWGISDWFQTLFITIAIFLLLDLISYLTHKRFPDEKDRTKRRILFFIISVIITLLAWEVYVYFKDKPDYSLIAWLIIKII